MIKLDNYQDRLDYLYIGDKVGGETFGVNRYLNQMFYLSQEWKHARDTVIIRDNGCDLAVPGCDIRSGKIMVHHINPITIDDIIQGRSCLTDPDNLISMTMKSHNYIHYGIRNTETNFYVERSPNDMCPWKK